MIVNKKNVAIFGDISTNGIDGSSIWLQSISSIFPKDKFNVYLILRDKITSRILLDEIPHVNIIDLFNNPYIVKDNENPCSTYELFTILNGLDKKIHLDHIILRAPRYLKELVNKADNPSYKKILSKVDTYFAKLNIYEDDYEQDIIKKALPYIARVILQTEEMRSYFDYKYPDFIGKVIVLNPIVPDFKKTMTKTIQKKIKNPILIYAGKLDKQYYVEDFLDLLFVDNFNKYQLMYVGSKINSSKLDKGFVSRIKEKLTNSENYSNFTWIKQLDRKATIQKVSQASFMLSLRQEVYDTSNEISTKLLEAMSVGTLPLLKKTAANIRLVGNDYPGFISSIDEIPSVVDSFVNYPKLYIYWSKKLQEVAQEYSFSNTYKIKLAPFYEQQEVIEKPILKEKMKVLIASHDNKFFTRVINELLKDNNLEVKFDNWITTLRHDVKKSKELLEWADVILCEWAVGAAVYYSQNKLPHQKLLIRLHRFEITTNQPNLIKFENVEKVIVVSDYIKNHCIENYGWLEEKISTIPQYADIDLFNRPKARSYQYTLGLLGMVPTLKRLDRALDILEHLRSLDSRYTLRIKSKHPWDIPFVWVKEDEKNYFLEQYQRIENNPILKNGVIFDEYGADVAAWFRKIGWMLSTSDIEGCHTAAAEGMASGAKPIIFNWPGAEGVYKNVPIFKDAKSAAEYIYSNDQFPEAEISKVKKYAKENFDLNITIKAYFNFIYKDLG
ncbi:glycosyltransferase [Acinetobacter sp. A47]|uniref:glycosyltransferase n=1 Tax=Acinetobacter sp. A47 TaxID=1561217 RepID=UPI00056DB31A|nr:glycosyltransferase [Acinetobacter sp. A47]